MPRKPNPHKHPKHVRTGNMPKGLKAYWQKVNAGRVKDPRTGKKKRHTA
jgi:hypothetical protein